MVCVVRTYLIQELPGQKVVGKLCWEIKVLDKNPSLNCGSWWCDGNGILRGNIRGSSFNDLTSVRKIST